MALMQRAAEVPQCRASLHQIETLRLDVHEGLGEQSHRPVELGPGLRPDGLAQALDPRLKMRSKKALLLRQVGTATSSPAIR